MSHFRYSLCGAWCNSCVDTCTITCCCCTYCTLSRQYNYVMNNNADGSMELGILFIALMFDSFFAATVFFPPAFLLQMYTVRRKIRSKYNLNGQGQLDDICAIICCPIPALLQQDLELKWRSHTYCSGKTIVQRPNVRSMSEGRSADSLPR